VSEIEPIADEAPAPKSKSDTVMRFASAGPVVPFIIWLLYYPPKWAFGIFVTFAVLITATELFAMMIPESKALRIWGTATTLLVAAAFAFGDTCPLGLGASIVGSISIVLFGTLISGLVVPDPVERAATRSAWLLGGPIYVGASLANVERLHLLESGGGWVIMAMMLAWFSDTSAYFAGRWFGKHKLYPKLSPKKTVEGAIGGLFGSVVGGLCGHFFLIPALPLVDAVVLALIAGAAGQAGDLFESLLKRSTGVKDSGTILPGHGGLLDRVDALMYTALITALYALFVLPHRG
jgi:phosphatidate cytidylyltransferase